MFHTSVLEISKSALQQNLQFLKQTFAPAKYSSVIKGNAYGHGTSHFVGLAEQCGIDHFSVFSADEAWQVIDASRKKPTVLIMGMIDNAQMTWAIENDVHFFVFEIDRLEHALAAAKRCGKKAKVHLELETGMNRTGLSDTEFDKAISLISSNSVHLEFEGLCTHFAGAESIANYLRIKEQIKNFKRYSRKIQRLGINPNKYHTACSAAAMKYPETRMNMVRIGILQYGFWPSKEIFIDYTAKNKTVEDPLERVISWKSSVMSTKKVKMGEFIGYGTSFLAQRDMTIATVPIGYSHGFSRSLSNAGRVLVHGVRVPVIGKVNMNALTLDISDMPNVNKGDEVVLIGKQGNLEISVSSFGELSDQLNYELLTRLPNDIPRKIVD